ncbi:MAG TPA: TrkA family potassium uptake protein [Dehalococcoidales bacterium]
MYIVVVGGGRVGYYLTKALLDEGHEVVILEKQTVICDAINDELGSVCVRGDGCETATLAEVGTDRADMLIAVTGEDEDNLVSCQLAKHKFKVPRTIARIVNPKNEVLFKKLGIDVTVSSTDIILESIEAEVPTHLLTHLMTIRDRGLEIVEIKIPTNSSAVGKTIKELELPSGSVLSLIIRKSSRPIVPQAETILQAGDQIIAVASPESEGALRTALRGS